MCDREKQISDRPRVGISSLKEESFPAVQSYVGGDRHLSRCKAAEGILPVSLSATVRERIRASWAPPHPVCDRSGMALASSAYQRWTEGHLLTAWLADNAYQSVRQSKYSDGGCRAADYVRKGPSAGHDEGSLHTEKCSFILVICCLMSLWSASVMNGII